MSTVVLNRQERHLTRRKIDHFDTEIHNLSAPTRRGNRESKRLCTMLPRFENHKGAHHLPREVVRFELRRYPNKREKGPLFGGKIARIRTEEPSAEIRLTSNSRRI